MSPLLAIALALQGASQTPPPQTPPARIPTAPPAVQAPAPNPVPPAAPAPDKVVATVGGVPLTAGDLAPYLWSWKMREVVQTLAVYRGIAAEATRLGVSATDTEVKAKYDEQVNAAGANLRPGQTVADALDRAGGYSGLALAIKSSILLDKIAEKEFDPSGYAKLSIILFNSADDKPPSVTAAKNADVAYKQLQSGTPWATVEKQFEKQPQLLQMNGSIGWTPLAGLPGDAKAQIAALKLQGYTKPVPMQSGVAIFRLDAPGGQATAADLATMKTNALAASRQAVIARIRAAAVVEFK